MNLFKLLLFIHITGGFLSLLIGSFLLFQKKGDKKHKLLGNIYFYSLLSSAIVSLPMSYIHPNHFLFIIGVFTSYMLLSGKRYLEKRKIEDVKIMDWTLTLLMLFFSVGFIGFGIHNLILAKSFGIVFLVFGGISMLFVYQDKRNFEGKSIIKNYWLTTHLQRMVGSYITSITAFVVVNNTFLPNVVAWLLPTVLLVPLIFIWTKKYKSSISIE